MEPGSRAHFDVRGALLHAYRINERVNQYLIERLDDCAWRAMSPSGGRSVAAIVAHMHNTRQMWLSAMNHPAPPEKLDAAVCTKAQAASALQRSARLCSEVLEAGLSRSDGKVKGFKPDAAAFAAYLIAHDAHHRGQIAVIAREAGCPLPKDVAYGMWEWGSRSREIET